MICRAQPRQAGLEMDVTLVVVDDEKIDTIRVMLAQRRRLTAASQVSSQTSDPLAVIAGSIATVAGPAANATCQPLSAKASAKARQRLTWPAPISGDASQRNSVEGLFCGHCTVAGHRRGSR